MVLLSVSMFGLAAVKSAETPRADHRHTDYNYDHRHTDYNYATIMPQTTIMPQHRGPNLCLTIVTC